MNLQRQITRLPNLRDGVSNLPTPANSMTMDILPVIVQRVRVKANGSQTVAVAAADDFGSMKLCDLPTGNIMVLGVNVDLVCTQAGFTSNNGTAIDAAIGTVATASADFSNAGEDNLMTKVDGTGTTSGLIKGAGASDGGLGPVLLAAGAKAIYLNIADPSTTAGVLTLVSGWVEILYIDMSDHG